MHFSSKAAYGLKAVLYLAHQYGQRAVSASQISKAERIPAAYLEQILFLLKRRKWVKSLRGPSGGYMLSRKPDEIKVSDILRDLEGGRFEIVKETAGEEPPLHPATITARVFWNDFTRHVSQFVESRSLKDLIDHAGLVKRDKIQKARLSFSI